MENKNILIVDDDNDVLEILIRKLKQKYKVSTANSVDDALNLVKNTSIDLIITDLVMPQRNGLELLNEITINYHHIPVIVISGNATLSMAIEAMKNGAADFVEKPIIDLNLLEIIIDKTFEANDNKLEIKRLKTLLHEDFDAGKIIYQSLSIQKALEKVKKIASVDTTVLITGETGVGKDLFASTIVANSERKGKRFVTVNCGSIPESLLESMLFGHKKGSFTSAFKDQIGYFEEANGGTIFLDEITETTPAFQIKLLRVLENKIVRKIGDNHDVPINVRVLAATNRDLAEEVKNGNFREDLYYRLNVIQLYIPPLRERPEDIQIISEHFRAEFAEKNKKPLYKIAPKTLDILLKQSWKGNVRELKNVIEHAVVMAMHESILPEDLPAYINPGSQVENTPEFSNVYLDLEYPDAKEQFEKSYLVQLLKKTNGDVSKAAEVSQIKRQNLYEKFKKYDIDPDKYRC